MVQHDNGFSCFDTSSDEAEDDGIAVHQKFQNDPQVMSSDSDDVNMFNTGSEAKLVAY